MIRWKRRCRWLWKKDSLKSRTGAVLRVWGNMGHRLNPDDTLENLGFPNMFWWNILREARFPLAATTDDHPESGSLPWPSATSKGSYGGGPPADPSNGAVVRMHQDPEISWDAEVGINCVPGRIKQRQSCDLFPECVARVPVSLWGSGGWGCVR